MLIVAVNKFIITSSWANLNQSSKQRVEFSTLEVSVSAASINIVMKQNGIT
jgi:hypothetical protein